MEAKKKTEQTTETNTIALPTSREALMKEKGLPTAAVAFEDDDNDEHRHNNRHRHIKRLHIRRRRRH